MNTVLPVIQGVKPEVSDIQHKAIKDAAKEFEAVFLNEMLKPMFEDMGVNDPAFGGSREEEIFNSMMIDEVSKKISSSGGIGIAKHVEKELLALQEISNQKQAGLK